MKRFVSDGKKFVLDTLFNFKPMKRFKNRRDVTEFGSFRNGASCGVENELKTGKLRLGKVQKERVAVMQFLVNKRCSDSLCSRVVESVSYPSKVTNR